MARIATLEIDPASLKPAPENVYLGYRRLYEYDPLPLDSKTEERDESQPHWISERVSFRARKLRSFLSFKLPGFPAFRLHPTSRPDERDHLASHQMRKPRGGGTYARRHVQAGRREPRPTCNIYDRRRLRRSARPARPVKSSPRDAGSGLAIGGVLYSPYSPYSP
jgi:hypothetical protein